MSLSKEQVLQLHPAALIRKAITRILQEVFSTRTSLTNIYDNRVSSFSRENLPAIAIYAESEQGLEERYSPPRHERALEITVNCISLPHEFLDDEIDMIRLLVEQALNIYSLTDTLNNIFIEASLEALDFGIMDFAYNSADIGMIADDARVLGCCSLTFTINYTMPKREILPDFIRFTAGMDQVGLGIDNKGPDGQMDIELDESFVTTWQNRSK